MINNAGLWNHMTQNIATTFSNWFQTQHTHKYTMTMPRTFVNIFFPSQPIIPKSATYKTALISLRLLRRATSGPAASWENFFTTYLVCDPLKCQPFYNQRLCVQRKLSCIHPHWPSSSLNFLLSSPHLHRRPSRLWLPNFLFYSFKRKNLKPNKDFSFLPSDCRTFKPLNWAIHVLVRRRKRQRWWWGVWRSGGHSEELPAGILNIISSFCGQKLKS